MDENWINDLSWSSRIFHQLVWPVLQEHMPGRLIHVEIITKSDFARDLDTISGIDAWLVVEGEGIKGIGSRVQVCSKDFCTFDTFTIRKARDTGVRTEYSKRKAAIDDGWLYPHLTIQSYVSSNDDDAELRSFAIANTSDIIKKIESWEQDDRPFNFEVGINRTYNAEFYYVSWTESLCQVIYSSENGAN